MSASENQPLCFVLMPFGSKPDPGGGPNIDFNSIYRHAIKPGIADADMFPVRADEEKLGGIIHKAMFERLLICDFAVADLTTSNPNVMYELGIRHAARPSTTLTIYAESTPLPFDVNLLRTQPYRLEEDNELSESSAAELRHAVTGHLRDLRTLAARQAFTDSPLFQLITRWKPQPLPLEAAEFFHDKVKQNERLKGQLRLIRQGSADVEQRPALLEGLASIRAEASAAGDTVDAGVLTELMLSYRALEAWSEMIAVYEAMPISLQQQVPIRQQLAFAYNRRAETTQQADDRAHALDILENLEREQGSSPETSGMIGRIYKSRGRRHPRLRPP
jgi:MAP3K TRAFs-binding domain